MAASCSQPWCRPAAPQADSAAAAAPAASMARAAAGLPSWQKRLRARGWRSARRAAGLAARAAAALEGDHLGRTGLAGHVVAVDARLPAGAGARTAIGRG